MNNEKDYIFEPSKCVPFRNLEILEKVRNIPRSEMEKHPNPDFKIRVVSDVYAMFIADMFTRIKESDDLDKKVVMILPCPGYGIYSTLAAMINRFRVNCRNVYLFNMDEWADYDGNVAPETYRQSLKRCLLKAVYEKIDEDLRMPLDHIQAPTTKTINDYSNIIAEVGDGGADICYSAVGWPGHIAFIDPGTFPANTLEEFMKLGSRIVPSHPLTIAENSLMGVYGLSGDVAAVPPCGATIGPIDIVRARNRMDMHGLTFGSSLSSWQRMISRLALYGPVSLDVPSSFLQLLPTSVYVSDAIAAPIICREYDNF